MRHFRHIQAYVLRQRGGRQRWAVLEPVVRKMTDREQEALFRTFQEADDEKEEAKRDVRRNPYKYFGS